jgi:uncharacterized alpha-E superfamily protein
LYREGLKPNCVTELLIIRRELPRSLAACAEEVVQHLSGIGKDTGLQGEADRLARARHVRLGEAKVERIISDGLHETLEDFIQDNATLHQAISRQFRFV